MSMLSLVALRRRLPAGSRPASAARAVFSPLLLASCLTALGVGARSAWSQSQAPPLLSNLSIGQSFGQEGGVFQAQPQVRIGFDLSGPADVTIRVARHLASAQQNQGEYLAEPIQVRTIQVGRRIAGHHEVLWDGTDDRAREITETQVVPPRTVADRPKREDLTREVPVNLFRINVQAGQSEVAANYRRLVGPVDPSRTMAGFMGAVPGSGGEVIVADGVSWRGRRYTANWGLKQVYPDPGATRADDAAQCYDVATDSAGNLYLMAPGGVHRYDPTGKPLAWASDAAYINFPYAFPGVTRNILGARLDPTVKEVPQRPNDSTSARNTGGIVPVAFVQGQPNLDPAELVQKPGFAYRWGGMALGPGDELFLGRVEPEPQIQVFDNTGKFLRTLALPTGALPESLRVGQDGALWSAGGGWLARIDGKTGATLSSQELPARFLHRGADGLMYAFTGSRLWRFAANGGPAPFAAKTPYLTEGGRELDLRSMPGRNTPDAPRVIRGVAGDAQGGFTLSVVPPPPPSVTEERPTPVARLLSFQADGDFQPEAVTATLGQHEPGNVFVDNDPARLEVWANNLDTKVRKLTATWNLTDFDGKKVAGVVEWQINPRSRQRFPLNLTAPTMGHYRLHVDLSSDDHAVGSIDTQLARIRSRRLIREEFSPFAMCWGTNFYLMGLAGVKTERIGSAYWGKIEPLEGLTMPDPPQAVQWPQSLSGYRKYAGKWSVAVPEGFSYGEPWLGGSFPGCRIYSYDRFYQYALRVVEQFSKENTPYYQFWNEPNFYWRVPGPFSREHFSLVQKHAWSITKARDKDALAISDGDAGSLKIMDDLARYGANQYNDTVQIHYPGTQPLKWDQLVIADQPEGRVPLIKELVALRDRLYPGKPIWNTEEGWWGAKTKTPEIGARVIPRIYLPQIAAGVDRIYWFAQSSGDDPTYLLDGDNAPHPSYCSYATMTRLLEGTEYAGPVNFGPATFGYLFASGGNAVLAAWSVQGSKQVTLDAGVDKAVGFDLMDRQFEIPATGGKLALTLTEQPIYIQLPRNAWVSDIARAELQRELAALKVADAAAIPAQVEAAAAAAATDASQMTRAYYLIEAARQAALVGDAPQVEMGTAAAVKGARDAIVRKEGTDGYQRRARTALRWTERLLRSAQRQNGRVAGGLAWAASLSARATNLISGAEAVDTPGIVVNAYLEPKAVREGADPAQPLDERFPFEIERAAGGTFELELTVWNYTRQAVAGSMAPRLPNGWKATPAREVFAVEPGKFERHTFTVTIPPNANPAVYQVGGQRTSRGQTGNEIHTVRVKVNPK